MNSISSLDIDVVVESNTSEHDVKRLDHMSEVEENNQIIVNLANRSTLMATKRRKLIIDLRGLAPVICSTYYIPAENMNLLSCSSLDKRSVTTIISSKVDYQVR